MTIAAAPSTSQLSHRLALALMVLLLLLPAWAGAQVRRTDGNGPGTTLSRGRIPSMGSNTTGQGGLQMADTTLSSGDSAATTGLQYHKETPDSILRERVFLFYYRPTYVKIDQLWNPTLAPTGIQYNDPIDALNGNYYLGKGLIGHPHVSIYPTLADGLDMQLQPDPNIVYAKRPTNIRLYQTMTPYTVLSYNSSLNKDYLVRVAHTQNIKPGWNVAMDYRLIAPEGIYTASSASNHYLDASTNYFSRDARLQATAGVVWNKMRIDENGGISDDTYFTQQRQSNRAGVPVRYTNKGTLHNELAAFGHLTYNLVRQFETERHRDSIALRTEGDSIVADTIDVVDTLRIHAPRVLNGGILGVELNYDRRKRVFDDSTWWQQSSATIFWTNDAYPDHRWRNPLKLTLGITPRLLTSAVGRDSLHYRSWLDPFARAELAVGAGTLVAEADLRGSLNDQGVPDTRWAAHFDMPLDSARRSTVGFGAVRQTKMPDVRMVQEALVNQNIALQSIVSDRYDFHFNLRDVVELDLHANHLSHNTWYDSLLFVREGTRPLWLYQASLTMHLALGWLHLDMQHLLQHSTDSVQMPVPLWATKNSLYADVNLFGRTIRAQIGIDIRYHTPFLAPGYDPASGLFYHQDRTAVGNYLWGDVFVNLNIKRASFYAKAGHLNALWETQPNYFILPHYPGQKFGFFWGITWHFFD